MARTFSDASHRLVVFVEKDIMQKCQEQLTDSNVVNVCFFSWKSAPTFLSKYEESEQKFLHSDKYKERCSGLSHPKHLYASHNLFGHSKVNLLALSKKLFPIYDYYMWVDFGCTDHPSSLLKLNKVCQSGKAVYALHKPLPLQPTSATDMMLSNDSFLTCSQFVVHNYIVEALESLYESTLLDLYRQGICDEDCNLVYQLINRVPALFQLEYTGKPSTMFAMIFNAYQPSLQEIDQLLASNFFASTTELCHIMKRQGSDKGLGWHNYTTFYDKLFSNMRNERVRLLEVGLGTNNILVPSNMGPDGVPGASLRGWSEYFANPKSIILGADVDANILFQTDRIKTFYCDQLQKTCIDELWKQVGALGIDEVDIILDDGLHTFAASWSMFSNSIHKLRKGGMYIVEDLVPDSKEQFLKTVKLMQEMYNLNYVAVISIPHDYNKTDNCILLAIK